MREELGKRQTVGRLNMKGDWWLTSLQQRSKEEAQQGAMVSGLFDHEDYAIELGDISQGAPASWRPRGQLIVHCT